MNAFSNILAVARREFTVRTRTRSFLAGTVILILGVVVIAFVPVIGRYLDQGKTDRIGLYVAAPGLRVDAAATLDALLNAPAAGSSAAAPGTSLAKRAYDVVPVTDLAAARADIRDGGFAAVFAIERTAGGDLGFRLFAAEPNSIGVARTAAILRQSANSLAIADRLGRLGIAPADQATLFAPSTFSLDAADPTRAGRTPTDEATSYALGFGMTILIFMMVILYGNWVAMSVVEEKSSRVMEVILNAATPFQLMTGKVLGVGAVALVQYLVILAVGAAAILLQGPIANALLGESGGSVGLPPGLTPGLLILLAVYGVLGFLLYAVLYAAAGSLVSRQEDVNQAVMPMTLVSTGGYLVAVYAATGLLDIRGSWLAVISQIPFFSPFMMLSRVAAGEIAAWEVLLSLVLLVLAIGAALWLAARIYAAGVLLYGQRPGVKAVWRLVRSGT
jgi:ABC-2 type transport system permease protein